MDLFKACGEGNLEVIKDLIKKISITKRLNGTPKVIRFLLRFNVLFISFVLMPYRFASKLRGGVSVLPPCQPRLKLAKHYNLSSFDDSIHEV